MFHEVDDALKALIRREIRNATSIEVLLEAPTKDWSARRNAPTLDLYLYDIREDLRRREIGAVDVHDGERRIIGRRPPPRVYQLSYLVTAWTQRPEDEHQLLAAALGCFIRHDLFPPDVLGPILTEQGYPVGLTIAMPQSESRTLSDIWTALGEVKPSLDLVVSLYMDTNRFEPAAPLAREVGLEVEDLRDPSASPAVETVSTARSSAPLDVEPSSKGQ